MGVTMRDLISHGDDYAAAAADDDDGMMRS